MVTDCLVHVTAITYSHEPAQKEKEGFHQFASIGFHISTTSRVTSLSWAGSTQPQRPSPITYLSISGL